MSETDPLDEKLERIGDDFTLNLLRSELSRHPENFEALSELAGLYTRRGQYHDGLQADLKLVQMRPQDPIVHYNLACSLARLGETEKACESLKQSIDLGYSDREFMLGDEDLASLRDLPQFQEILKALS